MLLVVGGSGRKAGKSSLVEGLIRALPEARWLALKISGHPHGAAEWELSRQETAGPDSDTGRFLAAGAAEAWWLRVAEGRLEEALPAVRRLLARGENAVVESNSIVGFLTPDLYLFVAGAEWKPSAGQWLERADAVVTAGATDAIVALVARHLPRRAGSGGQREEDRQ
ncbi:MAG: hypothetical protein HY822_17365 [Acidobacteria bacterium]|nr:hypothetical protein [Acidobacteriota bacterium]